MVHAHFKRLIVCKLGKIKWKLFCNQCLGRKFSWCCEKPSRCFMGVLIIVQIIVVYGTSFLRIASMGRRHRRIRFPCNGAGSAITWIKHGNFGSLFITHSHKSGNKVVSGNSMAQRNCTGNDQGISRIMMEFCLGALIQRVWRKYILRFWVIVMNRSL